MRTSFSKETKESRIWMKGKWVEYLTRTCLNVLLTDYELKIPNLPLLFDWASAPARRPGYVHYILLLSALHRSFLGQVCDRSYKSSVNTQNLFLRTSVKETFRITILKLKTASLCHVRCNILVVKPAYSNLVGIFPKSLVSSLNKLSTKSTKHF